MPPVDRARVTLEQLIRQASKAWHGVKLRQPDWSDHSHSLAFEVELRRKGLRVYLILNAYWKPLEFELPPAGEGAGSWRRWIDTALESPEDIVPWETAPSLPGHNYPAAAHSVVVLIGEVGRRDTRGYLDLAGQLVPDMPPAARVSEITLLGFVVALRQDDLSSETVYSTLRNLKDMLRVMDPVADIGILRRLVARLDRDRAPRRHKPQRIEDPRRLLRAGLEFIEGRAHSQEPGHHSQLRAGWARSGLIVCLLACRPLRLANLTAITLHRHLHRRGEAWWLRFAATETKERQPLEMPRPVVLAPLLEQYLSDWRPRLLRAESAALWISNRGRPMTEQAVYYQVVQVTQTMLGRPINPHLFRDSALTAAAEQSPEQVALVARMLGHRSLRTGERHYNHARQLLAHRRYMADLSRMVGDSESPVP